MKKVIGLLLFASLLLTGNTFSQSNNLDQFEGTWLWKSNDTVFTVKLKKVEFNGKKFDKQMPDTTVYIIIGWYELKVKDSVVKSSLSNARNTFDYDKKQHPLWGKAFDEKKNAMLYYLNSSKPVWFKILPGGDEALWEYTDKAIDTPKKALLTRKK